MEGLNPNGSGVKMGQLSELREGGNSGPEMNSDSGRNLGMEVHSSSNSESYLSLQNGESNCWGGGSNGWPDLAIYTPGSSYQ